METAAEERTVNEAKIKKKMRYGFLIFGILIIAYFFVYFQRVSVSILGQDMMITLGEDVNKIALLSSVYFAVYTAMQIPSGILADRLGPRWATGIFLMIATVGTFVSGYAMSLESALVGKALIAIGMAVVYIPLIRVIAIWFPNQDFAVLTGLVIAVGNVGAIAAGAPLSALNDLIGWRNVYLVLGVITLALALLCLLLVRNHPHEKGLPSTEDQIEFRTGVKSHIDTTEVMPVKDALIRTFFSGRKFWTLALAYMLMYGVIITYQGTWAKVYYTNTFDFVMDVAWFLTALGIGKMIATILAGRYISADLGHSTKKTMIVGNLLFLAVWMVLCFNGGGIDNYWFWMFINFMLGFFGGFMTVSFTQLKNLYPVSMSGTAVAAMNTFLMLGGTVMSSLSFMVISPDATSGFGSLWAFMAVCVVIATALCWLSVETRRE